MNVQRFICVSCLLVSELNEDKSKCVGCVSAFTEGFTLVYSTKRELLFYLKHTLLTFLYFFVFSKSLSTIKIIFGRPFDERREKMFEIGSMESSSFQDKITTRCDQEQCILYILIRTIHKPQCLHVVCKMVIVSNFIFNSLVRFDN